MFNNKDDSHEFKPILAEIEERPVNPLGRIIFWIIISAIFVGILWMFLGQIDVVVTAKGKIIPHGNIKILQPLETGVVEKILVQEGDYVKKGQVLMEVDPSTTEPALQSLNKSLVQLELESERLSASSDGNYFNPAIQDLEYELESLQTQQDLYYSSISSLNKQVAAKKMQLQQIDEQVKSANSEIEHAKGLLTIKKDKEKRLLNVIDLIAKKELDQAQEEISNYENRIKELTFKLEELKYSKQQINEEIAFLRQNFKKENLEQLAERQRQTNDLEANIMEIAFKNQKQKIVSPVDGYVNSLLIHTIGGVVTPAEKLMSIVPVNSDLVIKATVLNKDIGFVKEGMPVSIKIDTFSFQKYGLLDGEVIKVSKDSIEDERLGPIYEVYVKPLNKTLLVEGEEVSISTGMSVIAEIEVGKRRIIEFFIYPLIKYLDEGISVR